MHSVMLDIETLSAKPNAIVTSIAAVQFDMVSGKTFKEFSISLDWEPQQKLGRDLSIKSLKWWLKQDKDAVLGLLEESSLTVEEALHSFNKWLVSLGIHTSKIKIWGNGSSFDNVIVRSLYSDFNIPFVAPYWADCDVRTLVTLTRINTRDYKFIGTKHSAIDDCKHQINYCSDAYRKVFINKQG